MSGSKTNWSRGSIEANHLQSNLPNSQAEAAGPLQLCAGHENGCEAAVREVYNDSSMNGILLVDAYNAFNSLNHQAALRNVSKGTLSSTGPNKVVFP